MNGGITIPPARTTLSTFVLNVRYDIETCFIRTEYICCSRPNTGIDVANDLFFWIEVRNIL